MEPLPAIRISEVVDHSRIGAFQLGIFVLCGLCLIMDGFDVQAMGYVAPAIIREWKIPGSLLGPVFSAGLTGILIGSLIFSMLADRISRRPVLIAATLFFSAMTLLTTQASDLRQMMVIRLIAGMGLGGIMPNAVALVGEYSPQRARVAVMMIVANGFTAGAAIGGFFSAWLIPVYGWRAVFYFGASVPFVIGVLMIFRLPESLQFLVLRGKSLERAARWLKQVDPSAPPPSAARYVVEEKARRGFPIIYLFHDGRAAGTTLLWIVNFMNLLNLYFLSSWLPTVVTGAGYKTSTAVLVGTTVQAAGTIGAVALGWLVHRLGFIPVLTAGFAVACVNIALIGQPGISLALLFTVVFAAGFGIVGGQAGLNALAATYYPTHLRSTGIGSGLGVGRIGGIIGPLIGGRLMALHWSTHHLFLAAAVPALVSTLVMLGMSRVMKTTRVRG